MLINKSKFLNCCEYIDEINSCKLNELGFEDFFDMDNKLIRKLIKNWKNSRFKSLTNKDFILMHEHLWKIEEE